MAETADCSAMTLLLVEWSDAAHIAPGDWITELPASTEARVTTVGQLVRLTETHVVLAQSDAGDNTLTGVFSIPRVNILAVYLLRQHRQPIMLDNLLPNWSD